jgi:hypothetical protein
MVSRPYYLFLRDKPSDNGLVGFFCNSSQKVVTIFVVDSKEKNKVLRVCKDYVDVIVMIQRSFVKYMKRRGLIHHHFLKSDDEIIVNFEAIGIRLSTGTLI